MDEGWKNPNDIMKGRRIPRNPSRLSRSKSLNHSRRVSHPLPKENLPSAPDVDLDSLKRRNPFGRQVPEAKQKFLKRGHSIDTAEVAVNRLVSTDFFKEDQHSNVQQASSNDDIGVRTMKPTPTLRESKMAVNGSEVNGADSKETIMSEYEAADAAKASFPKPVMDWSLKTKMRVVITQNKSKTNHKNIPGIDAKHLNAFVKGCYESDEWDNLDVVHKIRRCSFHYSYPSMPWMSTFPRIKSYFKSRSSFLDTSNSTVLESLQKDWGRVFTSIYQQLRSGSCPYFYVNTHQFTVVFRCLRSSSTCYLTALLSPSTRGFRELLKKEGISFQMPNLKVETNLVDNKKEKKRELPKTPDCARVSASQKESEKGYQSNDDDLFDDGEESEGKTPVSCGASDNDGNTDGNADNCGDDTEDNDDDDDNHLASDWLEDMGLDKKDFPSLRPHNVKLQQENFREIDNRIQSMVSMDGLDVHAFFNFLLNYPGCIASSGPQYGIPPTVLSPLPFLGASLVENSVKQSVTADKGPSVPQRLPWKPNKSGDSQSQTSSTCCQVIEIAGPILPHHSLNIASVVQTLSSPSKLSYCPHPPTTAFNTHSHDNDNSNNNSNNTDNDNDNNKNSSSPHSSSLNILTTGLSKLLVPYSSDNFGLIRDVQEVMLSDGTVSVREASVVDHQFIID